MQRALLIDEILRQIFHFSLEHSPGTLSTLATICKAWNEPVLDYLWMRLTSIAPILRLIPCVELIGGQYVLKKNSSECNLARFHFYARRVRHISHCRSIRLHPDILHFFVSADSTLPRNIEVFPSLRTARVSSSTCDILCSPLSLSTKLQHLEIDLGFKTRSSASPRDNASSYLEEVIRVVPGLVKLSIRGSITRNHNLLISSMQNLRALSLRVGTSLTVEVLLAMMNFQHLSEVEIHVGHLDVEEFSTRFRDRNMPKLPSLKKLHIRAHTAMIEFFLSALTENTLRTLRMEVENSGDNLISWIPVFDLVCSRAENTLKDMTIEHHFELEGLDADSDISDSTNVSPNEDHADDNKPDIRFPFAALKVLGRLRGLRRFVLDTSLPALVCDQELEALVHWWPELEHLDLGSIPIAVVTERGSDTSLTLRSLIAVAKTMKNLTSLIIPINPSLSTIDTTPIPGIQGQTKLRQLTIGHPSTPTAGPLASILYQLFPNLVEVYGLPEQEEAWHDTHVALEKLQRTERTVL